MELQEIVACLLSGLSFSDRLYLIAERHESGLEHINIVHKNLFLNSQRRDIFLFLWNLIDQVLDRDKFLLFWRQFEMTLLGCNQTILNHRLFLTQFMQFWLIPFCFKKYDFLVLNFLNLCLDTLFLLCKSFDFFCAAWFVKFHLF